MAALREFSNLGLLAFAVREAPTLREALASMVRYMDRQNEALGMWGEEAGPQVGIRLQILERPARLDAPGHRLPPPPRAGYARRGRRRASREHQQAFRLR